ncbi:threonine/serine exporter family protein [Fusibacter paucivorans]|uniref:Threonine/serine exporter family protein n=1 Tax=Fusibacter paucivorans TaxID=76009 RepID=A0ABS5PSQ1_9FIRM|nr:threonine/serine exporter family protein [Fusibacter paucivorans]MBS7527419.1 threonine/serine exporter family protein [Fusibacter paucivorans]
MTKENRLIKLALTTGRVLLTNGAETYRVEDTVKRMLESRGMEEVNVFVIPTGIIMSTLDEGRNYSFLERVNPAGIDLEVIDRTNDFSRRFTSSKMSLSDAEQQLEALLATPSYGRVIRFIFCGMAGGFFIFLFGGTIVEFLIAYLASSLTVLFFDYLTKYKINFFVKHLLAGAAASALGVLSILGAHAIGVQADLNMIIIGPLMTLVPGVPLTNGIRDLISGELLSGSAKIMEALFVAIAIAFGVGIVLQLGLGIAA